MLRGAFAAIVLLASACTAETLDLLGSSQADADAGVRVDAGLAFPDAAIATDAGVVNGRDYWTLEQNEAWLTVPFPIFEGSTAFLTVEHYPDHVCEHGGPVTIGRSEGGQLVVNAYVWLHHIDEPYQGACGGITDRFVRHVPLPDLPAGEFYALEPVSGNSATIVIEPARECRISSGGECRMDCDCPNVNDKCIGPAPGVATLGRCGAPCEPVRSGCCGNLHPEVDLECPPEMYCQNNDGMFASGWCEARQTDRCDVEKTCPAGMECTEQSITTGCIWSVELNARVRHSCSGSEQCEPGLVCVGMGSEKSCEIPCFTNNSRCPTMHACLAEAGWVCEWIGE